MECRDDARTSPASLFVASAADGERGCLTVGEACKTMGEVAMHRKAGRTCGSCRDVLMRSKEESQWAGGGNGAVQKGVRANGSGRMPLASPSQGIRHAVRMHMVWS
eukprot:3672978-Pleurochrysis_carterae.AAC.1